MNHFKLILNEENFYNDFIYILKILALNAGQKDSSDVLIILPSTSDDTLKLLLEEEGIYSEIINGKTDFKISKRIRYVFIFSNKIKNEKELKADSLYPGITLIYTAKFPCPQDLKKLPYFNAATSKIKNYSLT